MYYDVCTQSCLDNATYIHPHVWLVLLVVTYFSGFRNISTVLNLAMSNEYDA